MRFKSIKSMPACLTLSMLIGCKVFCFGILLCSAPTYASASATHTQTNNTSSPAIILPKSITICTDTNFQFPFSFMKNQQPVGLHIDIIGAALAELGITPEYQPTTWESCLYRAKAGSVDAVATAAYLDERAAYMNYPKDASDANQSLWRITQVEYKVITPTFNPDGTPNHYVFNGDLSTLPEPVRVPAGYFIVHDLQKAGVKVKQNKNSMDNFQGLISDQTGSVIDLTEVATHLSMQADFGGKMQVQTNPFVVKSYYLAFSKKGNVSPPQAQVIWEHLAKVRENSKLMAGFLKQY